MHKSNKIRKIKIMPETAKIIDKYIDSVGDDLFPLKINWENQAKQIESKNAYYNGKLKKACNTAKIQEISFHTSRHSFADLAKNKGLDIHTTKELLGHSKVATTERYMKRFYEEQTDSAMDILFKL